MNLPAPATLQLQPEVRFDFRFDPNFKEHERRIGIRRELAHEFALAHAGREALEEIVLYPVARAGKSTSEVFYLDLSIADHEFPERFIAKFQGMTATEQEAKSARSAEIANLCSKVKVYRHASEDLGIIVYSLASARDHIEFRGYFLDIENADADCALALRATFQLVEGISNGAVACKRLVDDYAWYVERKSKPLQRIDALTAVAPPQAGLGEIAKRIKDTYEHIERDLNVEIHPYLVHGDLHARNLMLSRSNPARTELIDFGWVHSGHPAKDFVLMECTLKYMLLSEILPIAKGQSCEDLYIQARCIQSFEQFLCTHGFELPPAHEMVTAVFGNVSAPAHQVRALTRVYICVAEVRSSAGRTLRKYCTKHASPVLTAEQHYFASLFLVALGLLGLPEVDQLSAMIGLQTVGEML